MINELYINNRDAWLTWGVFLEDGSENKLLLSPSNKEFVENKSRGFAGKQIFANNSQPEDRDLQLVFCISAEDRKSFLKKYRALTNELNRGLLTMKVVALEEVYKFTTISYVELAFFDRIGKVAVKFNEPNPSDRDYLFPIAMVLSDKRDFVFRDSKNRVLTTKIK